MEQCPVGLGSASIRVRAIPEFGAAAFLKINRGAPISCTVQPLPKLEGAVRQVVFDCEQITVWSYPEQRLIHHEMHKYCHGEPFRAALSAGTQALQQQLALAWLSDDRRNGPVPHQDEEWAATWFQQTKAAGWKYWAMVLPERAVGKLNVKRLTESCRKRGIEAQMFPEPSAGWDWLQAALAGRAL